MSSSRSRRPRERRACLLRLIPRASKGRQTTVSVSHFPALLPYPVPLFPLTDLAHSSRFASSLPSSLLQDAIAPSGGRVITTLPVSPETASRRADVKAEFTLVYTELGYAFTFAKAFDFPASPEDNAGAYEWVSKELPSLLAGWSTEKNGSDKFKGQSLRVMEGGLDSKYSTIVVCDV